MSPWVLFKVVWSFLKFGGLGLKKAVEDEKAAARAKGREKIEVARFNVNLQEHRSTQDAVSDIPKQTVDLLERKMAENATPGRLGGPATELILAMYNSTDRVLQLSGGTFGTPAGCFEIVAGGKQLCDRTHIERSMQLQAGLRELEARSYVQAVGPSGGFGGKYYLNDAGHAEAFRMLKSGEASLGASWRLSVEDTGQRNWF